MLVQRKSVQNVQERPGIYTGFVKVDIEISKNVKIILKLQSVFKEIWKFIEEHCCTPRRTIHAYASYARSRSLDLDSRTILPRIKYLLVCVVAMHVRACVRVVHLCKFGININNIDPE